MIQQDIIPDSRVWIYFVCTSVLIYQYCIVHIAPNTWITYDKTYLIHWNLLFMYKSCMKIIWLCTSQNKVPVTDLDPHRSHTGVGGWLVPPSEWSPGPYALGPVVRGTNHPEFLPRVNGPPVSVGPPPRRVGNVAVSMLPYLEFQSWPSCCKCNIC